MYNLNQLNTFIKVAELGSFNKVAEEEFLSPNAVMMQINNLENELGGTKLFIRSKRGNRLTPAGELLYREAKKILDYCESSKKMVIEAGETEDSTVRVVVTYGSSLMLFEKLWKEVHRRYPEIRLEVSPIVYDEKSDRGLWSNFNEWTDIFLCNIDEIQAKSEGTVLYGNLDLGGIQIERFPLYCMVDCNHRLAEKEEITLDDLEGEKVAILSEGWGEKSKLLREYLEENYENIDLQVCPYFGAETYNECANDGLVIVGGFDSAKVHPFIKAIPFRRDDAACDNAIGLVYANPPSSPIEKFINAVSEVLREMSEIVLDI